MPEVLHPPILEGAPFIFPPASRSSDIRFGFKYVVSPFPTASDGAVVVTADDSDSNGDVGIEAPGMDISRLAANMAACTFVTLFCIPIVSNKLEFILLLGAGMDNVGVIDCKEDGIVQDGAKVAPKLNDGIPFDVIEVEIFPPCSYPIMGCCENCETLAEDVGKGEEGEDNEETPLKIEMGIAVCK